jgi:aryl carrier-like protein
MGMSDFEEILTTYAEIIRQMVNRPGDRVMPADFSPVETHASECITGDGFSREESEREEDSTTVIIRGLLSRFSKLPEKLIRGTTSLASMGVDSITAMQIASLARKQGIFVSPVTIIQSTNVHDLMVKIHAEHMEESSGSDSTTTPQPAQAEIPSPLADAIRTTMPRHLRQYIEVVYPVSPGMEWMIGAWQNSGGCRYQHAFIQRVRGRVDVRRLEQSWDALLKFHPILRSTFCPVPALKGNSDHLLALCVLDMLPGITKRLTRRKLPRLRSEEQALAVEARMSVIHPAASPGIHARLTVLEGRYDTYLLLNFHHFQYGECPLFQITR